MKLLTMQAYIIGSNVGDLPAEWADSDPFLGPTAILLPLVARRTASLLGIEFGTQARNRPPDGLSAIREVL